MRKIRLVLGMHQNGYSIRRIARSTGISRSTITDYLTRAKLARLAMPLPDGMDDHRLEDLLFPVASSHLRAIEEQPNWRVIHQEKMARSDATLQVLHSDYLELHPSGMKYSYFCESYRRYVNTLKRYLRRIYEPGERILVDYAGRTVPIVNIKTGESSKAQIFVGILPASRYTYAEAHHSQSLPDWIAAHCRMLEFFGGAPKVIVCDNLKAGVTKASRLEPVVNSTYQNFAEHYGMVVVPTRPRRPKDKAPVENAVLVVERWILFRLRHRIVTSLDELNAAIRELLIDLNSRHFQKLEGSRLSLFESMERSALSPLPAKRYEYVEIMFARVGLAYCVTVHGTSYSVPEYLVRQEVEVRISIEMIEVVYRGKRVTSYIRKDNGGMVVNPDHMPPSHKAFACWESSTTLDFASQNGEHILKLVETMLHPVKTREQGYRLHQTLRHLVADFGAARVNTACAIAISIGLPKFSNVRSLLTNKLD